MSSADESLTLLDKINLLEEKAKKIEKQLTNKAQDEASLQLIADGLSLLCSDQDMLLVQFQNNMNAFKHFDRNVYDFFATYQPSRYIVDIVDGFPNVFDQQSQSYLYQYPPYLMALAQFRQFQESPQSTHSAFDPNEENRNNFLHSEYLNKVLDVLAKRVELEQKQDKELPSNIASLMMFGAGIGYQLELLLLNHSVQNLYVIEPNADLFYASLFTANWAFILETMDRNKANLHLSIEVEGNQFFDDLLYQTHQNGRYDIVKTFGYIHYQTPAIRELLVIYKQRFKEFIQGWGFFDDGVMAVAHTLGNIENKVPIVKKAAKTNAAYANTPVFVIGNGPSLDQSIEVIKEHQDKAIIVSCGSALSALINYGVEVDYHCEQERTYPVVEKVKDYGRSSAIRKRILLAPATVHPEVFEQFDRAIMFPKAREPSTEMLVDCAVTDNLFEPTMYINPTVSNTGVAAMYALGYRKFYLFGVDLGHKRGGKHHSDKSLYYSQDGEDLELYTTELSDNTVPGNLGGEFICDDFFNMSRCMIEKFLHVCGDAQCYNFSDGAKINGAQAASSLDFGDRTVIDKSEHLAEVIASQTFKDSDGQLYSEFLNQVCSQRFEDICHELADMISKEVTSFKEAILTLRKQSLFMAKLSTGRESHLALLLDGSLLHFQAMLTRVLYEPYSEASALADFNQAAAYFRAFLLAAPEPYRKNYNIPQTSDVEWWND